MLPQPPLATRRSTRSPSRTRLIGMEVHTATLAGASVAQAHGAEVLSLGTMGTRQCASAHRVRQVPVQVVKTGLTPQIAPSDRWREAEMVQLHPAGPLRTPL
jgi:hypothetical protein